MPERVQRHFTAATVDKHINEVFTLPPRDSGGGMKANLLTLKGDYLVGIVRLSATFSYDFAKPLASGLAKS